MAINTPTDTPKAKPAKSPKKNKTQTAAKADNNALEKLAKELGVSVKDLAKKLTTPIIDPPLKSTLTPGGIGALGPKEAVKQAGKAATEQFKGPLLRILTGVAGFILVIVGLTIVTMRSEAAQTAAATALKVVK